MYVSFKSSTLLHPVMQWVASPTADPGVRSFIPAQSHTFMKNDNEIIFTVILFLPLIQEGLLSVTNENMCTKLSQACPGKNLISKLTVAVEM